MAWWWSWLITFPQLFAYWQVGNHHRWAWLIAFCVDVLWVVYALVSHQYGFLVSAVLFGGLAARNWWLWGHEVHDPQRLPVRRKRPPGNQQA